MTIDVYPILSVPATAHLRLFQLKNNYISFAFYVLFELLSLM